jgi:Protein of unknown function (DUF2911)
MGTRACWLAVVLLLPALGFVAFAAAKPDPETTVCTFEDGNQISARYIPTTTDKDKLQNGKVWTPGGSPILLFTSTETTFGSSTVPVGAFSLYVIPAKDRWTMIVNKNVNPEAKYDEHQDLARAPMELGQVGEPAKELQLAFVRVASKECNLRIYFGKDGAWAEFKEK